MTDLSRMFEPAGTAGVLLPPPRMATIRGGGTFDHTAEKGFPMKRSWMYAAAVVAAVAVTGVTGASMAQEDPIKARQELMKDNGRQAKIVGEMAQGKTAFDAAAAKAALEKMATDVDAFVTHFPEGSDQGETEALPAIWQDKADFEARAAKMATDARAAAAAVDQGEDAFKAAAGVMFGNCKACHEVYRKPS